MDPAAAKIYADTCMDKVDDVSKTVYPALAVEHPRISEDDQKDLAERGHTICRVTTNGYSDKLVIQSAAIDLVTGERLGASDNRLPKDHQGPVGQEE